MHARVKMQIIAEGKDLTIDALVLDRMETRHCHVSMSIGSEALEINIGNIVWF